MPKHGFARHSCFDLVRHERDRAVFRLADSEATQHHYPFAFRLDIDFALYGARLTVAARIANRGDRPMPEIGRAHVELQSLIRNSYAVFCLTKQQHTSHAVYALAKRNTTNDHDRNEDYISFNQFT